MPRSGGIIQGRGRGGEGKGRERGGEGRERGREGRGRGGGGRGELCLVLAKQWQLSLISIPT